MATPKPDAAPASTVTPFGATSTRRIPMRIIVLGLGRTGTTSMQNALEILGFPTYHATDIWVAPIEHIRLWNRAMDSKYNPSSGAQPLTRDDWDILLGSHAACVDVPMCWFGPELAEIYPDAKFVVQERHDGVEPWFRSCVAAFGHRRQSSWKMAFFTTVIYWDARMRELRRFMNKKQHVVWGFEWQDKGAHDKAVVWYRDYYAEMRRAIPAERRIDFTVADGWEPLCEYLGVEVPMGVDELGRKKEMPFPRGNEAAAFVAKVGGVMKMVTNEGLKQWAVRIMAVAAGVVVVRGYVWGPANEVAGMLRGYLTK